MMTFTNNTTVEHSPWEDPHAGLLSLKSCVESQVYRTFSLTFLSTLMVVVFLGNGMILVSYIKFPNLRASLYTLIVNLSVADILLGIHILLLPLEEMFTNLKGYKMFCLVKFSFVRLFICSSLLIHILIAVDRFLAIKMPMKHLKYSRKKRLLWTILACIWTASVASAISMFFASGYPEHALDEETDHFVCAYGGFLNNESSTNVLFTVILSTIILIVTALDVTLYCLIRRIVTHKDRRKRLNVGKNKIAMFNMILVIYIVFVVSWAPLLVASVVSICYPDVHSLLCAKAWLPFLAFSNSGMNWLVYGYANPKFKQAFKYLLTCGQLPWRRTVSGQFSI